VKFKVIDVQTGEVDEGNKYLVDKNGVFYQLLDIGLLIIVSNAHKRVVFLLGGEATGG